MINQGILLSMAKKASLREVLTLAELNGLKLFDSPEEAFSAEDLDTPLTSLPGSIWLELFIKMVGMHISEQIATPQSLEASLRTSGPHSQTLALRFNKRKQQFEIED